MKTKIYTALASLLTISTLGFGCSKPAAKPNCLIGRGVWVTKWTMVDATDPTGPCASKTSELLSINKYQALISSDNPNPPASIAIKPFELVTQDDNGDPTVRADESSKDRTDFSIGTIANDSAPVTEDGNQFCTATGLTVASGPQSVPDYNLGGTTGLTVSYKWTNFKWLMDASHPGQQFTADLEYTTDPGTTGSCTAHYEVSGLFGYSVFTGFPQICDTDADCLPIANKHDSHYVANWNSPVLGLDLTNVGSGFNPDYPVVCDKTLADATIEEEVGLLGYSFQSWNDVVQPFYEQAYGIDVGTLPYTTGFGACFIEPGRKFPALCQPNDPNVGCKQAAAAAANK